MVESGGKIGSGNILTSVYSRWFKESRQAGEKGVGDQGDKKDHLVYLGRIRTSPRSGVRD